MYQNHWLIYMHVLAVSSHVPLVKSKCKSDLSLSSKAIIYGTSMDEDIYFYLPMGFPTSPLVGVQTRDYSMVDRKFPVILTFEEVVNIKLLKPFKARG